MPPVSNPPRTLAGMDEDSNDDFKAALKFSDFELADIIEGGQPLLASGGEEFEIDWSKVDPKKRLEVQRKRLLKRLGFSKKIDCGMNVT